MTHRLVAEHPPIRTINEQRGRLEEARQRFLTRQQELERRHRDAEREWLQEVDRATVEGREPPPTPEPPNSAGDYQAFMRETERLRDAERQVLADDGRLLELALTNLERELLERAGHRVTGQDDGGGTHSGRASDPLKLEASENWSALDGAGNLYLGARSISPDRHESAIRIRKVTAASPD